MNIEQDPNRVCIRPSTVATVTYPRRADPLFVDCSARFNNYGMCETDFKVASADLALLDTVNAHLAYNRDTVSNVIHRITSDYDSGLYRTNPALWSTYFEEALRTYARDCLHLFSLGKPTVSIVPASDLYLVDASVPADTTMSLYVGEHGYYYGDTVVKPRLDYLCDDNKWVWWTICRSKQSQIERNNATMVSGELDESEWLAQLPKDTLKFRFLNASAVRQGEFVREDLWNALNRASNDMRRYCETKQQGADREMIKSYDKMRITDSEDGDEAVDMNGDEDDW